MWLDRGSKEKSINEKISINYINNIKFYETYVSFKKFSYLKIFGDDFHDDNYTKNPLLKMLIEFYRNFTFFK